ncbi:hypothetical protein LSH36_92g04006 [Paralvinella palmiformis]|uniref:Protein SON n=1 Tax=Paralvinella palmiformis TaxID=53620 RepID=A0AAD9ND24_9ANNE|nr:hypothetical protein LSH36_92g04006 [Paralvinella palmiformis]
MKGVSQNSFTLRRDEAINGKSINIPDQDHHPGQDRGRGQDRGLDEVSGPSLLMKKGECGGPGQGQEVTGEVDHLTITEDTPGILSVDTVDSSHGMKRKKARTASDPELDKAVYSCPFNVNRQQKVNSRHVTVGLIQDDDRSKSRDHHHNYPRSRPFRRQKSRSWSRSRSRSPVSKEATDAARLQIDKAQLRKIAFQNAYAHLRKGKLPNLGLKPAEVAALKAGGKSVEELTDFCKKIVEKGNTFIPSDESDGDAKENSSDNEAPFVHHPFRMRDNASIVMNIRNARQLPVLTTAQKQALGNELRLQFPVSSGTQHRDKEREWVPVETTTATSTTSTVTTVAKTNINQDAAKPADDATTVPDDKVFPDIANVEINIKDVVSERLSALRKLNENPNDPQAMGAICRAQEAMNKWAQSKDLPGYFTGSTGANVLSQAELAGMHQAWARKDQLINAAPVTGGIGKFLLKKMGWKEGEGLGKAGAGSKEPLMLDFKLDRKGLASSGEAMKKTPTVPLTKDLSNKHPVSALVELCNRRKWQPPNFVLVHESGPDHKKNFLFKVIVNANEYQSTIVSTNKKHAKAQAATICLQQLGLVPPGS